LEKLFYGGTMSEDAKDKIIFLKSTIFDLQIQYGKIRQEIEIKLKELNDLNKKED
jgi:hypothetical protein